MLKKYLKMRYWIMGKKYEHDSRLKEKRLQSKYERFWIREQPFQGIIWNGLNTLKQFKDLFASLKLLGSEFCRYLEYFSVEKRVLCLMIFSLRKDFWRVFFWGENIKCSSNLFKKYSISIWFWTNSFHSCWFKWKR